MRLVETERIILNVNFNKFARYGKPPLSKVKKIYTLNIAVHSTHPAQILSYQYYVSPLIQQAETFLGNYVANYATSVDNAFQIMHNHFYTASFVEQTQTKWNTLKFSDVAQSYPNKNMTEIHDELASQGRDLQTLLGHPYTERRFLKIF